MKAIFAILLGLFSVASAFAQAADYEQFFTDKCLRIDYELVGRNDTEFVVLKDLLVQGQWAGKKAVSSQLAQLGNYRFSLTDSLTGRLLYSNGFSGLFNEWQQSPEAKHTTASFYHVNLAPFPKQTVLFRLERTNYSTPGYSTIAEFYINPKSKFIRRESTKRVKYTVIQGGGDNNDKIDIAFLAEGYTADQMEKFRADVKSFWKYMTGVEPYKSHVEMFNVYAVESPSEESGTDVPNKGVFRNTAMNFTFSTFNIDRYLTSFDLKSIHDIAATVPYEHIIIIINTDEYGGGGFYNFYSACVADHKLSKRVLVHEFGHAFAGLADEYYYADEANESMYSLEREPWEPNITTLNNFNEKWLVDPQTPIPTPRTKEYADKVGVFQGGGYQSEGIYSPFQDCIMRSNTPKTFCPVCRRAIERAMGLGD
ncbi:MAG: peptidase M64 [Salinivirgaceae bacterium]|nr:peptidase M64 [Salinivirgaceae bacterium]